MFRLVMLRRKISIFILIVHINLHRSQWTLQHPFRPIAVFYSIVQSSVAVLLTHLFTEELRGAFKSLR